MNRRPLRLLALLGGALMMLLAACGLPGTGTHTLTVNLAGNGSGTVTSQPEGIDVSSGEATATFDEGTVVTLTASPDAGSSFAGWTGACENATAECVVTMDDSRQVTATFQADDQQPDEFTLTVTTEGDGEGTITSDVGGIDCGGADGTCDATFESGDEVQLTADAAEGSVFSSWGGDCSGQDATCTVTMNQDRTVSATFAPEGEGPFALTVDVQGGGTGSVTSDPAGIDCPDDCDEDFADGADVTLTASPEGESTFAGWGGACSGSDPECTVTMSTATTVVATFEAGGEEVTESFDIQQSSDDAEEFASEVNAGFPAGSTQETSSDLDMNYADGENVTTTVGLRYQNVTIPQGAQIVSASITFTEDTDGPGSPTYTIAGEATDSAETFQYEESPGVPTINNITGRSTTAASVDWTSVGDWNGTADTPDLASVVQEIVDRGGWSEGNAMAFIISSDDSDASNYRVAESFDGGTAPVLNVTYTAPANN